MKYADQQFEDFWTSYAPEWDTVDVNGEVLVRKQWKDVMRRQISGMIPDNSTDLLYDIARPLCKIEPGIIDEDGDVNEIVLGVVLDKALEYLFNKHVEGTK